MSVLARTLPILQIATALAVYLMVQLDLIFIAFLLPLASKWQIFSSNRRYWWTNIKANAADIVVLLSLVGLMAYYPGLSYPDSLVGIVLVIFYLLWVLLIKPGTTPVMVGVQALTTQFLGFTILFTYGQRWPGVVVLAFAWLISVIAVKHFLSSYSEPLPKLFVAIWSLLMVQTVWVFWQWSINYTIPVVDFHIPQVALISLLLGYCLGVLYRDNYAKKLNRKRLFRHLTFCVLLFAFVLYATQWRFSL